MKQDGFTLIEMLIVIAIAAIIMAIATINFGTWTAKSNIEGEIREMYADLMTARARAIDTNRTHSVAFSGVQYTITDDTGAVIIRKTMKNPITVAGGALSFDNRGLASITSPAAITISLTNNAGAVFDCIIIEQTRMNMGIMSGGACVRR